MSVCKNNTVAASPSSDNAFPIAVVVDWQTQSFALPPRVNLPNRQSPVGTSGGLTKCLSIQKNHFTDKQDMQHYLRIDIHSIPVALTRRLTIKL